MDQEKVFGEVLERKKAFSAFKNIKLIEAKNVLFFQRS